MNQAELKKHMNILKTIELRKNSAKQAFFSFSIIIDSSVRFEKLLLPALNEIHGLLRDQKGLTINKEEISQQRLNDTWDKVTLIIRHKGVVFNEDYVESYILIIEHKIKSKIENILDLDFYCANGKKGYFTLQTKGL